MKISAPPFLIGPGKSWEPIWRGQKSLRLQIRDGIDLRDTLRHWYEGDIYVKVLPPNRGNLDAAVMLFDSPADPRDYPWRTTWFAEHRDESTLAFYATDFRQQAVGPGICLATYGGAMFVVSASRDPGYLAEPPL